MFVWVGAKTEASMQPRTYSNKEKLPDISLIPLHVMIRLISLGTQLVNRANAVVYEVVEIEPKKILNQPFYLLKNNLTRKLRRVSLQQIQLEYMFDCEMAYTAYVVE